MAINLNDKVLFSRILEIEKLLASEDEYIKLYEERNKTLSKYKNLVTWREFDEFLCCDNALSYFLMYYFYNKGLSDGFQSNK